MANALLITSCNSCLEFADIACLKISRFVVCVCVCVNYFCMRCLSHIRAEYKNITSDLVKSGLQALLIIQPQFFPSGPTVPSGPWPALY